MVEQRHTKLDWLGVLPMATLLAVVLSAATGLVHLIDPDKLSFEQYMTQIVVLWGGISVGRGLASKKALVDERPWVRLINSFPWATVVAAIVAVVGYADVVLSSNSSLDWDEYTKQMGVLIGALGIGRGIGVLKKDTAGTPLMEPEDDHIDLVEDDEGIEPVTPVTPLE